MKRISRRSFVVGTAALKMPTLTGSMLSSCATPDSNSTSNQRQDENQASSNNPAETPVYFTSDISSSALLRIWEHLDVQLPENVAVKLSTGVPGGHNFLQSELITDFVHAVNGTIVERNTAYGRSRGSTESHLRAAKDHGFTAIAEVDIMDADDSLSIPVSGGGITSK